MHDRDLMKRFEEGVYLGHASKRVYLTYLAIATQLDQTLPDGAQKRKSLKSLLRSRRTSLRVAEQMDREKREGLLHSSDLLERGVLVSRYEVARNVLRREILNFSRIPDHSESVIQPTELITDGGGTATLRNLARIMEMVDLVADLKHGVEETLR